MKRIKCTTITFMVFAVSAVLVSSVAAAGHFDVMATGNARVILPGGEKIIDNTGTVALGIALDFPHMGGVDAIVLEFDQGTQDEVRFIWQIWSTKELTIKGESVIVYLAKPPVVPEGTNHDAKDDLLGPIVLTIKDNQVRLVGAHNVYFEGSIIA